MSRSLLLLLLCVAACRCAPDALPPLPQEDVVLAVDDLGITHVTARNDLDVMWGGGYAMARDRLLQAELMRRRAYGTSAEVHGERTLSQDVLARAFDFPRLAAQDEALTREESPEDALLVEAWAAGINARLDEIRAGTVARPFGFGPDALDFVPEPWTATDILAVGKALSLGLSGGFEAELLATLIERLAPDLAGLPLQLPAYDTFSAPVTTAGATPWLVPPRAGRPPAERSVAPPPTLAWRTQLESFASNNWAVAGRHTENGRPLLAGDPHQPLSNPNVLWPVHLSSLDGGGTYDVMGFSFAGSAAVQLGWNRWIGWTATTAQADAADLFDVELDRERLEATFGDRIATVTRRSEVIRVRDVGAPVGEGRDETVEVFEVPGEGVFLPGSALPVPKELVASHELFVRWVGFAPTTEGRAYLAMGRARNLDAFVDAARLLDVGMQNFVAADRDGIVYLAHGVLPDRGDPSANPMPDRVLPAEYADVHWNGKVLPASKLPFVRDPPSGLLVTANNDPFGFTRDGRIDNDPWYYTAFPNNGQRAHAITRALEGLVASGRPLTADDMQALQFDASSVSADTLLPVLADALAHVDDDPALARWRGDARLAALGGALGQWDRRYTRSRGEPVLYVATLWFAAKAAFGEAAGPLIFDAVGSKSPAFWLGQLENVLRERFPAWRDFAPDGKRALVLGALADASAWLRTRFGTDDLAQLRWDAFHGADFLGVWREGIETVRTGVEGGPDSINISPAAFFGGGAPRETLSAREAGVYRMVLAFDETGPVATVNMALGADGDPTSPTARNLHDAWTEGRYDQWRFRAADVAAHTASTVTLPKATR